MKMSYAQAEKAQFGILELFENEFKRGRSAISNTGAIKFSTEKAFGIYYQLYELLRGSYPSMAEEVTDHLRIKYRNKTWDDVQKENDKINVYEDLMLMIDGEEVEVEIE